MSAIRFALILTLTLAAVGCRGGLTARTMWYSPGATLVEVATSERQWTGLAVASDGRMFVNYPLWSESQPFAVGRIGDDGVVVPYPDREWNRSRGNSEDRFVCVQAMWTDRENRLWILDPANPRFEGVVPGGPKLVVVDLGTNQVERIYRFEAPVVKPSSYLNDGRLDLDAGVAYLTDSGDGAMIVLDLESGEARRLLDDHPSTEAEEVVLTIEGEEWRRGGVAPRVHADGLALSLDKKTLYFQALTGRTLWSVRTKSLRDPELEPRILALRTRPFGIVGPSDGLLCGPDGAVYLTSLEENAIRRVWPKTRRLETVVQDERIAWPDSMAIGPGAALYFTTAQIHRGPTPPEPYRIFRVDR
ncbi:MAG: L-dopachrome tautomerase-related protein [Planctomycetota bacterium]